MKATSKVRLVIMELNGPFTEWSRSTRRILEDGVGSALWCGYRRNHLVSQHGLPFLNMKCKELMTLVNSGKLDRKDDKAVLEWLIDFYSEISHEERSGDWLNGERHREWALKVLPFVRGDMQFEFKSGGLLVEDWDL